MASGAFTRSAGLGAPVIMFPEQDSAGDVPGKGPDTRGISPSVAEMTCRIVLCRWCLLTRRPTVFRFRSC